MKKIGFVGLGTMGAYMSRNIQNAGFELFVYNRTRARMQPLIDDGAIPCDSPAQVGERCEMVVTCVSDVPDVEEVILGTQGIAQGMKTGGIIADCSTSSPTLAQRMEAKLKPRGIGILDTPVSGGPEGAQNASLSIMAGGDESIFERALPVLQAMGKTITLVGPAGAGQLTKAINQIIGALHLEAVAEGLALAQKSGIDPEKVLQAVSGGAAQSWLMQRRGPSMIKEKFNPVYFALNLHAKDLRIAMQAAKDCGAQLDLAKRINEIVQGLIQEGHGGLDHSSVYLYMKKENQL